MSTVARVVDLSVIIPAFNEEQRLGPTLDAVTGYLRDNEGRWGEWEVVVADDGSTDGTRELVTAREDPRVQLVTSPRNRGKGNVLRVGVAARGGRRVLVTDADLASPIEDLEQLDKALSEGNTAAIGSRAGLPRRGAAAARDDRHDAVRGRLRRRTQGCGPAVLAAAAQRPGDRRRGLSAACSGSVSRCCR
ncbi:glycosyltransferase [Streptomyces sp. NBC_00114]|uniref:glycosyltransferase n=1 Tax=Streptomyces sp. NBC_00114 TaxID=2975656 RepID=UPI00386FC0DD